MLKLAKIDYSCTKQELIDILKMYLKNTDSMSVFDEDNCIGIVFDDCDRLSYDFIKYLEIEYAEMIHLEYEVFGGVLAKKEESKVLPISLRKDISLFPKELLPLQLPIFDDYKSPWFYSHFISTYYNPSCFFDYTDERKIDEILQIITLSYESFCNVSSEAFVDAISKGYYIDVWVDNYYITSSRYYKVSHDIHPVLIRGYDNSRQVYSCVRFESDRGLQLIEIAYDELHYSVNAAKLYFCFPSESPLRYLKVKDFISPNKNAANHFIHELDNYICGIGDRDYSYYSVLHFNSRPKEDYYGIKVTEAIIDILRGKRPCNIFDYRVLHMVVENKQHICDAVSYFNQSKNKKEEINKAKAEYQKICDEYQIVRMIWIRSSLRESNTNEFYAAPNDITVKLRIADKLEKLLTLEIKVLRIIISLYEEKMILDRELINGNKIALSLPDYIDGIDLYSKTGRIDGTLRLNGKQISIDYSQVFYGCIHVDTGVVFAEKIEFSSRQSDVVVIPYKQNLVKKARISASSVFKGLPFELVQPQNVALPIDSGREWIVDANDHERSLLVEFEEKQLISSFSICQNAEEQRVIEFVLCAELSDKTWKEIFRSRSRLQALPEIKSFKPILTRKVKLQITKTEMSENGCDIPRIAFFGLFQ